MFHIYISVLCLASNINACWDLMFLKTVQCLFLHVHRIIVSQDLTSCWEGIRWHVPMKSLWGLARWNASVLKMIRNIVSSVLAIYMYPGHFTDTCLDFDLYETWILAGISCVWKLNDTILVFACSLIARSSAHRVWLHAWKESADVFPWDLR